MDIFLDRPYKPKLAGIEKVGDKPNGFLLRRWRSEARYDKPLRCSTSTLFVWYLVQFVRFLIRHPSILDGQLSCDDLRRILFALEGCRKSFSSRRMQEDMDRRLQTIGAYCDPSIFGSFLASRLLLSCCRDATQVQRRPTKKKFDQLGMYLCYVRPIPMPVGPAT